MIHNRKQQTIFYSYINNCIDNPHLSLYIRELLKGEDVQTKQYVSKLPPCVTLKQVAYELLWTYVKLLGLDNQYLNNTLESVTLQLNKDTWAELKVELKQHIELLNLPPL